VTDVKTVGPSIQSKGIGTVQLPVGDYTLALQNIIYMPDLKLNILSTERLKRNNYIRYSNWILYHLFDRATGKTIVEADRLSGLLVISVNQSGELYYFEALDLYYIDIVNRQISLDLAYYRLGYISKALAKKVVEISTSINLKGIDAYKYANERCDKYMAGQIKAKPFPLRQPPKRRVIRLFEIIYIDLLTGPEEVLDGYFKYLLVIVNDYSRYL
jgi:hypothetical protein